MAAASPDRETTNRSEPVTICEFMSRNEWVTEPVTAPDRMRMKAGPTTACRQGSSMAIRSSRPTFLRLPAAGATKCATLRVGSHAATLRPRQDAAVDLYAIITFAIAPGIAEFWFRQTNTPRARCNRGPTKTRRKRGGFLAAARVSWFVYRPEPCPMRPQIATRTPSSTTRSYGIRKNSVAGTAFRARTRNSQCRHQGSFGTVPGTSTSRPRK